MPLATDSAFQLRFRVSDKPRRTTQTVYGDGLSSAFELGALPGGIVSAQGAGGQPSAFVQAGGTAWSATGATFTYFPGIVTLSGVPSAGTAVQVIFHHAVFSEAEVDYITANFGDLNGMTLEVINSLMGDYSRRVAWGGGGVNYNESTMMRNLQDWRASVRSAQTVEQGPQGGFESWADEQENYPGSTNGPGW